MEASMAAMFPKGIRALMVDDDNRFVRSASTLLSVLNFEVVTCSTVAHALKSLSTLQLKDIDVVLVHAAKASACGFNFRAIIETDLAIPVIYFLPLDHRATGDEAEELLSTLEAGTYVMATPLDVDEVRSRLWKVIAWRKCALERRPATGGGLQEGEDDEGRVHYKVVRCRKRKGGSSNAGEGSSAVGAGAGGRAPPPPGKGKEKVVEAGDYQQQPSRQKKCRGRKSKKSSGEAFKPPPFQLNFKEPNKAMPGQPPVRQPPRPSLFVNSVLKTIKVPPHNANFFSNSAGPSNATPPPPRPPLFSEAPPPPPLTPAARHQQPTAHNVVFGNVAPPAPFESFPYQGPQPKPHVAPQDMVAPAPAPAGDLFTGAMAGGGSTAGASVATGAGAYCNDGASSLLQPQNLAGAMDMGMDAGWADPPEHVVFHASQEAAMMESLFNNINSHGPSGSPLVATVDQVLLGMSSSNVSGPAIAGAEFGSWDAAPASFMAPQDLGAELHAGGSGSSNPASFMAPHQSLIGGAPNGGNKDATLFMAPHQDHGAAMDRDAGLMADMLASDQYGDDDTSFPLEALLNGLPSPLLFADLDGGAAAAGATGDSLISGEEEEGGDMNDLEGLNGLEIPHDVFQLDDFMYPPHHKNKNSGRE